MIYIYQDLYYYHLRYMRENVKICHIYMYMYKVVLTIENFCMTSGMTSGRWLRVFMERESFNLVFFCFDSRGREWGGGVEQI